MHFMNARKHNQIRSVVSGNIGIKGDLGYKFVAPMWHLRGFRPSPQIIMSARGTKADHGLQRREIYRQASMLSDVAA